MSRAFRNVLCTTGAIAVAAGALARAAHDVWTGPTRARHLASRPRRRRT
ncbi:MAG TPA: hypothetical protein VF169_12995 [Albitalea sp.]